MIDLILPLLAVASATGTDAQTAPAETTEWIYKETRNEETGAHAAYAYIRSIDGSGTRLIVRCDVVDVPVVTVQFIPKPSMPGGDSRNVTVTFDNAKADTSAWSFPGAGGFVAEPTEVYLLTSQIAGAKEIDVALHADDGSVVGATFNGPKSDALFRQVYGACGATYALPAASPAPAPSR